MKKQSTKKQSKAERKIKIHGQCKKQSHKPSRKNAKNGSLATGLAHRDANDESLLFKRSLFPFLLGRSPPPPGIGCTKNGCKNLRLIGTPSLSLSLLLSLPLRTVSWTLLPGRMRQKSPFLPPFCRVFTVGFRQVKRQQAYEVAEQNKMVENVKCGCDAGSRNNA